MKMEDKRLKFSYEDTDRSVEIELYGLVFEIKDLDSIEDLKELDKNNVNVIEKQLEKILGEGSIEKINNKRRKDGYRELDLNIELNILGCIFETYAKSMANAVLGKTVNAVEDINKNIGNFKGQNREERRNYNRNYNRNRRNYRRY